MMFYYYAIGDQIFVKIKGNIRKLDTSKKGPYTITYVFTNNTVAILCVKVN